MAGTQASWRAVWCHERCFRPECKTARNEFAMVVRNACGSLLCFKKSQQFVLWLAMKQMTSYFLLTDWREAKPCINALQEADVTYWPFRIIVLCDTAKQFEKASHWAEQNSQVHMHDIHVCNSAEPLPCLFAALVGPTSETLIRLPPKNEEEPGGSQIPMLKLLDGLHNRESFTHKSD